MSEKKFNIVICACARDENDYIIEWIEYHRMIGVEHFYIYDHLSKEPLQMLIGDFKDVTLIEWKEEEYHAHLHFFGTAQYRMYNDYFTQYSNDTKWVAYIDLDEFIVLKKHQTIQQFLLGFDNHIGAVSLNWVLFGSNGKIKKELGKVVDRFTHRAAGVERVVKTISKVDCIDVVCDMHLCKLKDGYKRISANGQEQEWWDSKDGREDIACIYHYPIKSIEELDKKLIRGWPVAKYMYKKKKYLMNYDKNEKEDLYLVNKIKQIIN